MAGIAAVLLMSGCPEELPPRSFVQPNVIKKTDLQGGTWYYLQTVTDTPPTNGATFNGLSSELMKVRFDIQEGFIYARRAFEWVEGSEDSCERDKLDGKLCLGQPLAAWRIASHFDIIRDYNPTTGEQTNRVIETQERPWYEREFIRVDWSQQQVTDYIGLGINLWIDDVTVQPVSYWESDPTHPDALHMERATTSEDHQREGFAEGQMTYLDVTNQMIVTPDETTGCYEEAGQRHCFTYPSCFFSHKIDDCASQQIKVRHAFARIGPKHTYETRSWNGTQMELFGVWDVGLRRLVYNRQYPFTRNSTRRVAARFNLWKQSCKQGTVCGHGPADHRNSDGNFSELHHVDFQPSPSDQRIPYGERGLRQIPYYAEGSLAHTFQGDPQFPDGYTTQIYPPELIPQYREVIRQWNEAFMDAAKDLIGKRPDEDILLPCHNPVRRIPYTMVVDGQEIEIPADPPACLADLAAEMGPDGEPLLDKQGQPIVRARQGDPRRSIIFWVNQYQAAGPLGYGPPMYDPETGETISGQAYIYGGSVDLYSTRSRDLVLLQNGEIPFSDYTDGVDARERVSSNPRGVFRTQSQTFDPQQIMAMSKGMNFDWALSFTKGNGYPPIDTTSTTAIKDSMRAREDLIYTNFFEHMRPGIRTEKLSRLVGSPLERLMITPELMAAGGVAPGRNWDELNDAEKAHVSPLRMKAIAADQERKRIKAEQIGVDFALFDDPNLDQTLRRYRQKFCPDDPDYCFFMEDGTNGPRSQKLLEQMRREIFLGVTLHEVGHNVGCRHNFRGSYDSLNYHPGYWQTRTEAAANAGAPRLHARYLNVPGGALSQYERDNQIYEYQYSSIMDYSSEYNGDLRGLGLYDKAHIKFSYAEHVEVFTGMKQGDETAGKIGALQDFQGAYGLPSALAPSANFQAIPYYSYPELFENGWEGIYERADVPYADVARLPGQTTIWGDSLGRPFVPYYFCSDEFAGNLTCQRFDSGADVYEQAADVVSRYNNFYLLNNFWRDKINFYMSAGYPSRIEGRYFRLLRQQLTWYALLRGNFQGSLFDYYTAVGGNVNGIVEEMNKFWAEEDNWGSFTVGVNLGFEALGKVLTTPSAGSFVKNTDPSGKPYWKFWRDDLLGQDASIRQIDFLDGKWTQTVWDFDRCGYYWSDECQRRIGYMIDKVVALDVLSQSQAYFTGRDTNADVREYAIGYILPFKKQIEEKFGAIFADDFQGYAPYFKQCTTQMVNEGRCRNTSYYVPTQRSWAMPNPDEESNQERLDPGTGFTVQLWAGVYGLSSFPTTFDPEFIDTTKIFVVGNGEAVIPDEQILVEGTYDESELTSKGGVKEWLLFKDDLSGKIYAAKSVPARETLVLEPRGTPANLWQTKTVNLRSDQGVRMIARLSLLNRQLTDALALPDADVAKVAKVAIAQTNYDKFRQNVEVMRSLHKAFGYGQYKTDAPFYY